VTTTTPAAPPAAAPVRDAARPRIAGLDGLRGLAALYVLLFHCWLYTFVGYPENPGPAWLGWLMYGRLAVVFFLVVSGFSLALTAAADGWRLGGARRFLRRRAWRILPPYWAALALSLAILWVFEGASREPGPTLRTVAVYGALVQDLVPERTPNAAFWSIAIEAELYLLFPLVLLLRRRLGAVALLGGVTLATVLLGLLAPGGTPGEGSHGLMPHLAPVFVAGVVAAGIVTARDRVRRLPWTWLSLVTAAPVLALIVRRGSVWTVEHYFWIDLAVVPAMTFLLVAVATGRPAPLVRLLSTRPLTALGSMSYSLYLIHVPIVMVVARVLRPHVVGTYGEQAFWFTLAVGVPLSLAASWLFARTFELPFQRHRSWRSLRSALRPRATAARP
jgi:peptidoglycan/LPS O-acetylase OafA/YrhL